MLTCTRIPLHRRLLWSLLLAALSTIPAIGWCTNRLVPSQYATIGAAVTAAAPGDTVIVSPGTYVEAVDIPNKLITVTGTDPNDNSTVATTIVQCPSGSTAAITSANTTYSNTQYTTICGLTVTGPHIGISLGLGSHYIDHCRIDNNGGTGIACDGSWVHVMNSTVYHNTTGITASNSYATLMYDEIMSNTSIGCMLSQAAPSTMVQACWVHHNNSHGVVLDNGSAESNAIYYNGGVGLIVDASGAASGTAQVSWNQIWENETGMALQISGARALSINHNLLYSNQTTISTARGGGLYCVISGGADVDFYNNTVADNVSPNGGGMYCTVADGSSFDIRSSIISGNSGYGILRPTTTGTLNLSYCDVWGNTIQNLQGINGAAGKGNISADPLYSTVMPAQYRLQSTVGHYDVGYGWHVDAANSPCIDTGDPAADFSQEQAPNGGRINMGWGGGTPYASKSDRPPTAPTTVTLSPSSPLPSANLTAAAEGATDPDGDTVVYQYQWAMSTDQGHTWSQWQTSNPMLSHMCTEAGQRWRSRARASDRSKFSRWVVSNYVDVLSMMSSHIPHSGVRGVLRRTRVFITFRWPVVQGSAASHFTLKGPGGVVIPGSFTWPISSQELCFTPNAPLDGLTLYTVNLASGIERVGRAPMAWAESFSFTTREQPVVTAWSPQGNQVGGREHIVVDFDMDMHRVSVQSNFAITPGATGRFGWNGSREFIFIPGLPLSPNTDYQVTIQRNARSVSGLPLAKVFTWTFHTASSPTAAPLTLAALAASTRGGTAQVTVSLTTAATVEVRVCNLAGVEIAALAPRDLPAGVSTLLWDGRTSSGTRAPAGSYLLRVKATTQNSRAQSLAVLRR